MKQFIAILLTGMLLCACVGCTCSGVIRYANADKYTPGGFTYDESRITEVDVEWAAGGVTLKNGSGTLSVSESGGDSLSEADRMHWWIDGSTLRIRYCKSGHAVNVRASEKHLTLELPEEVDLDIDVASGKIQAEGTLTLRTLDVETASGGMEIETLFAKSVEIDSASGALKLGNVTVTDGISVETASGGLTVTEISADSVRIESASGGISLGVGAVNSVEIESASGGITIRLASAERGAKIRAKTVSGGVNVKLPNIKEGNMYTIGNGECRIDVEAASGSVTVE